MDKMLVSQSLFNIKDTILFLYHIRGSLTRDMSQLLELQWQISSWNNQSNSIALFLLLWTIHNDYYAGSIQYSALGCSERSCYSVSAVVLPYTTLLPSQFSYRSKWQAKFPSQTSSFQPRSAPGLCSISSSPQHCTVKSC